MAVQEWTGSAGAVQFMDGTCAESLDNQSKAAVINAHGSLDRLWSRALRGHGILGRIGLVSQLLQGSDSSNFFWVVHRTLFWTRVSGLVCLLPKSGSFAGHWH